MQEKTEDNEMYFIITEYTLMTLEELYIMKNELELENAQSFDLELIEQEIKRRKKQKINNHSST
jgi:hypothetical protein